MKSANVATGADMPIDLSSISPALINPADNLMTIGLGLNTINREGIDTTDVEDTVRPNSVFNTEGNTPLENLMQYFKDLPEHADGASFIPRDNYLASLHKGEAVVTADANALIRTFLNNSLRFKSSSDSEYSSENCISTILYLLF